MSLYTIAQGSRNAEVRPLCYGVKIIPISDSTKNQLKKLSHSVPDCYSLPNAT